MIRCMEAAGWCYYSEVTIDKNPMLKASRTKEATLLFKTLAADSAGSRPALADYIIVFKKPGENSNPIRAGISERYDNREGWITGDEWCEWAAPVWYRKMPSEKSPHYPFQGNDPSRHQDTDGINEGDVLRNFTEGRENDDEKHLVHEPHRHAVNDQKGNNNPPKRHLQPPKQCKPKHRFLHNLHFRFRQKQLDLQKLRKLQPQQFFQQLLPFQLLKQLFGQQPFQRKFGEPQQFLRRFQQGRLFKEISPYFPRQYEFPKAI